ncbi:MAG: hypothetical protein NWE96_02965 [Candidatus Bathyarchaeota archaeon]|nr:hypothetical protein [Candidatus Bathyarchaeota archaeon]
MNWKNVLALIRVERKSGRLIRGVKKTRYKENRFLAYWPYWVAAIIGVLGGLGANAIASEVYSSPSEISLPPLETSALGFFIIMPTLVLIFSIVFSMLQQIQMSGVKVTSRVNYWLPITWQEQTLASILANLMGLPVALTIGFAAGLLVFAGLNGLILPALVTTVFMLAAAFMGSSTTEILRIIQVRFTGAVYKSSGRAAVWVRFIGSITFFIVFYVVYLSITQGFTNFIQGLTTFQSSFWFIPFVWPGLTLFYVFYGMLLEGALFIALTAAFIAALYLSAVKLNERFGLYEPPAIRIQAGGTYTPKTGILGKLGFTSAEAAIIRKDIRSFTRRRELIGLFIVPVVFVIIPLMQSIGITNQGAPQEVSLMFLAMVFLLSSSIMAMSLGNMLIGEEGEAVWRIYASPISPKNLVKSKFAFLLFFAIITLLITGTIGTLFYNPPVNIIAVGFLQGLFLIFPVGSIALSIGFKGADFSVTPRPRMIRPSWSYLSLGACALAALGILSPFIPSLLGMMLSSNLTFESLAAIDFTIPVIISAVISAVITVVFYRINLNSAEELIRKAEI